MRNNYKKLTLRLDQKEYAHLLSLSHITGLKFEPLLRKLILEQNLRPRPPDEYAALLRQLSGIGTNVNQIAHRVNARQCATMTDLTELDALVREAYRLVKETL